MISLSSTANGFIASFLSSYGYLKKPFGAQGKITPFARR